MAKVDESYIERLCNAIAKTMVEAIENLTIEDVNMYKVGYNKAIDEFAERMKELNECGEISVFGWNRIVNEIAEQMKGGV